MRLRISLTGLTLVLLASWLALTTLRRTAGRYVLELPATYLSVGQQFQPRLMFVGGGGAPAAVSFQLLDSAGRVIAAREVTAQAPQTGGPALALPHAGAFTLRAAGPNGTQSVALHAIREPSGMLGGVLAVVTLGISPGVNDYLRQHSFVTTPAADPLTPGALPNAPLYLVGDPRLEGTHLDAAYAALWQRISNGGNALLLEPPPPGVALLWPLAPPLRAASSGCDTDLYEPRFTAGLPGNDGLGALLHPKLAFDLSGQNQVDLYHWNGYMLPRRNPQAGYAGCYPLFSYRYGDGWVTVSTLPLLQHFQDTRARIYLMNLMTALARRKHYVPNSPGLAWVTEHRLAAMAKTPPSGTTALDEAAYYLAPPSPLEPVPQLVPQATGAGAHACWHSPPTRQDGATVTLNFSQPQAVKALDLDFGPGAPPAYGLEASADGVHWRTLPVPTAGTVAVPAGTWQAFRLDVTGAPQGFALCHFAAH